MASTVDSENAVIDSTGNVFADLGLDLTEEDMLKVRIARVISNVAQEGGYTQACVAAIIGIDQPKVSKIMRGRLKEFSVRRLMQFLMLLGVDIEVRLRKTQANKPGRLRVVA